MPTNDTINDPTSNPSPASTPKPTNEPTHHQTPHPTPNPTPMTSDFPTKFESCSEIDFSLGLTIIVPTVFDERKIIFMSFCEPENGDNTCERQGLCLKVTKEMLHN